MKLEIVDDDERVACGLSGTLPINLKHGHYELAEEIGRGGIGKVFRAIDTILHRKVAIKVLREELAQDPAFADELLQEARAAAAISHPHIGCVFALGNDDGCYYIVMELLRGRALDRVIDDDGALPEAQALQIAIEVALALKAAHHSRLIHGDIKPANIFLTEGAGSKVLDFGLARRATLGLWWGDSVLGSPYYVSPERLLRKAETCCSDMYSLGATLFHMLTGHPPFDGESYEEVAVKRLEEKPLRLRELNPNVTARTEHVVDTMLNQAASLRYGDYDDLLAALLEVSPNGSALRRTYRNFLRRNT